MRSPTSRVGNKAIMGREQADVPGSEGKWESGAVALEPAGVSNYDSRWNREIQLG